MTAVGEYGGSPILHLWPTTRIVLGRARNRSGVLSQDRDTTKRTPRTRANVERALPSTVKIEQTLLSSEPVLSAVCCGSGGVSTVVYRLCTTDESSFEPASRKPENLPLLAPSSGQ